jgi:hypothetical protein
MKRRKFQKKSSAYKEKGWLRLIPKSMSDSALLKEALEKYDSFRERLKERCGKMAIQGDDAMPCPESHFDVTHLIDQEGDDFSEFCQSRQVFDKHGEPATHAAGCPYPVVPDWSVVVAKNRMTIYNDKSWDGFLRPCFSLFNVDSLPGKSQMDVFKNEKPDKMRLTVADWLGNDVEVCLLFADCSGGLYMVDLHQRVIIQASFPWGKNKGVEVCSIRVNYDLCVFAVKGTNGEVKVYSTSRMLPPCHRYHLVATCDDVPEFEAMDWIGTKLVFNTTKAFFEFDICAADLLAKQSQYAKKPHKMKFKSIYHPETVKPTDKMLGFIKHDDEHVLVSFERGGTAELHSLDAEELVMQYDHVHISPDASLALDHTGKILAVARTKGQVTFLTSGNDFEMQEFRRPLTTRPYKVMCFWSKGAHDTLLVYLENKVVRYCIRGDRLKTSKPTPLSAYYETALPWGFKNASMDNTNVDHDHRDNQDENYNELEAGLGEVEEEEDLTQSIINNAEKETKGHINKRNRVLRLQYETATGITLPEYDENEEFKLPGDAHLTMLNVDASVEDKGPKIAPEEAAVGAMDEDSSDEEESEDDENDGEDEESDGEEEVGDENASEAEEDNAVDGESEENDVEESEIDENASENENVDNLQTDQGGKRSNSTEGKEDAKRIRMEETSYVRKTKR